MRGSKWKTGQRRAVNLANCIYSDFEEEDAGMMRVAIAGTGGLAYLIAHFLQEDTGHPFVLLSRSPKPHLAEQGFQVMVVDYDDPASLSYALTGVQVVISTVPGIVQIRLIDAAISAGVQRFAPAEFEGRPSLRPIDPLDRGKSAVLAHLQQNSDKISWGVFVCGILYERFAPGGMFSSNIGIGSGISGEGDYMMDLRQMTAQVPHMNAAGQYVTLCLTAAQDVARFVVKSLEFPTWPQEMTMSGERMTTQQLIGLAENVRGRYFFPNVTWHNAQSLQNEVSTAQLTVDAGRYQRALSLAATLNGQYDFTQSTLNASFPDYKTLAFETWLSTVWAGQ